MSQPTYEFLNLTPASQRHLFTKMCEFDIACNNFAKVAKKDICQIRQELLTEAYLATWRFTSLAIALEFTAQKEFNFDEVAPETQRFIHFRLQAAETAKDWVLIFKEGRIRDVQAIEDEAKSYTDQAPDEEIAAFFQAKSTQPPYCKIYDTLGQEAAIA